MRLLSLFWRLPRPTLDRAQLEQRCGAVRKMPHSPERNNMSIRKSENRKAAYFCEQNFTIRQAKNWRLPQKVQACMSTTEKCK